MATVQRANVILQIADEPAVIQKYKDKGYSVINNKTGEILEPATPHGEEALQILVLELQAQLKKKDSEIKSLKSKIKKLQKEAEKSE